MMTPRWKKVVADLRANITRTLLVAMSIAVGVFAVGMIAEGRERMIRGMSEDYLAGNPFSFFISTDEPFDEDLVEAVRNVPGVGEAEGRSSVSLRMQVGPNEWETLSLMAIRDFDDIRISQMEPERGPWPPPDETIVIERSALSPLLGVGLEVGQTLRVETLDQEIDRTIPIVGVAHDMHIPPTFIFGTYYGYITEETLEWLGRDRDYVDLYVMVDEAHLFDVEYVNEVAFAVRDKVERSGREVTDIFVPPQPGESPTVTFGLKPITFIMSALGVLTVFLSGFLVTNTLSAMLAQQVKHIGIMKSIGARTGDVMQMYVVLVLAFGGIGLLIGVPLAYLAAGVFVQFFAELFNFDPRTYGIVPSVAAVMLFVGLVVPLLASIFPIMRGTGLTIREALSSDSGPGTYGQGFLDKLLDKIRGVPRPMLLSMRNTIRRKGRLALTLITLTMGGATFISVFSVQDSITVTLDELFSSLIRYDVQIDFAEDYRVERIEEEALKVPGVVDAEAWGGTLARRLRPDDTESEIVFFAAPPQDSDLLDPEVVQGRWLLPADQNAVVLSSSWLKDETDIDIGDTVVLKFKGRETDWVVVGFFRGLGSELLAYANYDYFSREVREAGVSNNLRVVAQLHTPEFQASIAQQLEQHFRSVGLTVTDSETAAQSRQSSEDQFGIITSLLMMMALLVAVVGGLGLMGTMSMNVLERTREIGVMRAIGASDGAILNIVITEGIIIGLMSWACGAALALPISRLLSDQVGILFVGSPFTYVYSANGALIWLGLALLLAALASFLPAWNASRLTVRDVLAFDG